MKYKDYSEQLWLEIQTWIKKSVEAGNAIAAFDADGTLWDTDLGENFFQYKIDHKLVKLPANPWDHYRQLKKQNNDPRSAYLWLAQICEGQKIETVKDWAQKAFETLKPYPIFSEQKKLIDLLLKNNVKVYIVTASVRWAVEPGARALGLSDENVIGIETAIENGLVTTKQKGIITYRQGKTDALLEKTNGLKPFFSSGNSEGDIELLEGATEMALAVSAASRDDQLFKSESKLFQIVNDKSAAANHSKIWRTHRWLQG